MPPAKLACRGCRLSKVKCDLEAVQTDKCTRCTRLGLLCLPTGPSKRGRPHAARDISRLGPAVRKLLQSAQGGLDQEEGDVSGALIESRRADLQANFSHRDANVRAQAARVISAHLTTRSSRWAWLRHVLYVSQRGRDLEAMATTMLTAARFGFSLDEVQGAFALVALDEEPAEEPLPDFLSEWHTDDCISLTRCQNHGYTNWRPSGGFRAMFSVGERMEQGMINMLERGDDREHVVDLTGRLWAQISAETTAPQYVQVEGERPISFTVKGQQHGPFRMRGRLVVKDRSLQTWTCINLVPVPPFAPPALELMQSGFPAAFSLVGVSAVATYGAPPPQPVYAATAGSELGDLVDAVAPQGKQPSVPPRHAYQGADVSAMDDLFNAGELDALFGNSSVSVDLDDTLPLDELLELVSDEGPI